MKAVKKPARLEIVQKMPIFATIYKIVIDTILFFVTFRVQREWVFKKKTAKGRTK